MRQKLGKGTEQSGVSAVGEEGSVVVEAVDHSRKEGEDEIPETNFLAFEGRQVPHGVDAKSLKGLCEV
jgi:hypothetical protein